MRKEKLSALIAKSIDGTTAILFRPFSIKKWLKLLFIAFLAGTLFGAGGGSGGSGGGGGGNNTHQVQKKNMPQTTEHSKETHKLGTGAPKSRELSVSSTPLKTPVAKSQVMLIIALISIVVILFILLSIFISWITARFKFAWFNAVINNKTSVMESYSLHRIEANSLFKLFVAWMFVGLIFLGLIGLWIYYALRMHGVFTPGFTWSVSIGLKIFLPPVITALVGIIFSLILAYFIDHFAITIMALDGLKTVAGLKIFRNIFKANWRDILLFTLIFFLLSIAGGAITFILVIFAVILLILIALIIFGLPALVTLVLLKAKLVFLVYAIAAGIPFALISIVMLMVVSLPFAVFFRLFSINYLISLNCGYTQDTLNIYATKGAGRISSKVPIILAIIGLFLVFVIFIVGLLAAIAIPNFIKARQTAIEQLEAPSSSSSHYFSYYYEMRYKIHEIVSKKYDAKYGEGTVTVNFILDQDGNLLNTATVDDKSCDILDLRSLAIECVKEAAPFGPYPYTLKHNQISFNIPIIFKKNN